MLTAEEKARNIVDKWFKNNGSKARIHSQLVIAMKEQDEITRHACAENTTKEDTASSDDESYNQGWEDCADKMHNIIMNTKAV